MSVTESPPAPLWQRIARALSDEIDGQSPGARLASEAQLAGRFGVNRHTVRRAIESLVRQGRLRVEQGRGAFVADEVLDYAISSRTRFSEWVRRHDKVPAGEVLRLREVPARHDVAAALGIGEGDEVAVLERLGRADGIPISLTDHHFPVARLPGILAALRSAPTITEALARVGVPDYTRQSTRVSARMPSETEAGLLHIDRARPLLVCENLNIGPDGAVVEFGLGRYPSARVQVVFEP